MEIPVLKGMGKRIVCYAIFGHREFYWPHFPALVRAHHTLFKGWEMRVYTDSSIFSARAMMLRAYAKAGLVNVIHHEENKGHCRSMLWRCLPIWDENVDYVLSRDVDSLPTIKDRRSVEQFIQSGATLHVVNDNPAHTVPVMGGMCGFNAPKFREKTGIKDWNDFVSRRTDLDATMGGTDQILLYFEAWQRCFPDVCEHRFAGYRTHEQATASYTTADVFPVEGVEGDMEGTNGLINFLGAPGYGIQAAIDYFEKHGDQEFMRKLRDLESQVVHKTPLEVQKGQPAKALAWRHYDKQVILAANENETYDFFLPLTAMMWKKFGYHPYINLVSNSFYQKTPRLQYILRKLQEMDAKIHWLPEIEGFASHNIAQLSRLYSGCSTMDDTVQVITGDADMWPLSQEFFTAPEKDTMKFWNFQGMDCFFICYCCGTVAQWREYMGTIKHTPMKKALQIVLEARVSKGKENWGIDEGILNEFRRDYKGKVEIISREVDPVTSLPIGRVDRANWPLSLQRTVEMWGPRDAHMVRPGFTYWGHCIDLIQRVHPDLVEWANDYYSGYMQVGQKGPVKQLQVSRMIEVKDGRP